ncbi:MAG: L,D-transpeptidase [Actinomycetota bacterium]
MSRSRRVLLAAWGLLLVGSIVHFVLPEEGGPANEAATDTDRSDTDGAPDELAFRDGSARSFQRASDAYDGGDPETDTAEDGQGEETGSTEAKPADVEAATEEPSPLPPVESFVAIVRGEGVEPSADPGGPGSGMWFPNPTQFGGERVFLVVDQTSSPDFVKVSLPVKPNGQEGWLPRTEVELRRVDHRAEINLTDNSVTVWDGDQVIVETKAVTGKPETPTPVGTFYVRDVIGQADPGGDFGPYIVALSGFSEVLDTFNGALPALAIHGTNRPDQIGTERSSGCVRIPNDLITLVATTVPLGTPVTVVA